MDPAHVRATVVSMYDGDPTVMAEVEAIPNVQTIRLGKSGRWDFVALLRLAAVVRRLQPDVLHGYMSGANEIAQTLGWLFRRPVVWGVRVSDQTFDGYSRFRKWVFDAGNRVARWADLVIANSAAGRQAHIAYGYPADRVVVIHNGIDTVRFRPDVAAGQRWRAANGLAPDDFIVLLPARLDPMKDHELFLAAAARFPLRVFDRPVRFVCVGRGEGDAETRLRGRAEELRIADRTLWLAPTRDVTGLYNASDLVCSTSRFGEGFPNVLGEAMACGRICVATRCGDAAEVVGDAGFISPVGDAVEYASQLCRAGQLAPEEISRLSAAARNRMVEHFGIELLVRKTTAALSAVHCSWEAGKRRGSEIAAAAREAIVDE